MKVANPDYVVGSKPPYKVQPPIEHPPFCVCDLCPANRERAAAAQGITLDEVWSKPLVIRRKRASPSPDNYVETVAFVRQLLVEEPKRLAAAVRAAEEAKRAKQNAKSFGDITDAYRRYLKAEGKRYGASAEFTFATAGDRSDTFARLMLLCSGGRGSLRRRLDRRIETLRPMSAAVRRA